MSQRKKKKKEEKKGEKERNSEQVNERGQLSKLRWDGTSDLVLAKAPWKKEEEKREKKKERKKKKDKKIEWGSINRELRRDGVQVSERGELPEFRGDGAIETVSNQDSTC